MGMEDQISAVRANPKRNMFCIDDFKNYVIYGNEKNSEYQRFEVVLVPCNYLHTLFGYTEDSIHPECVADLNEQLEYLGPLNLKVYHTQE